MYKKILIRLVLIFILFVSNIVEAKECDTEKLIKIWKNFKISKDVDETFRQLDGLKIENPECKGNYNFLTLYFFIKSLKTEQLYNSELYIHKARTACNATTIEILKKDLCTSIAYCKEIREYLDKNTKDLFVEYEKIKNSKIVACYIGMKLNPKGSDRLGNLIIYFKFPINSYNVSDIEENKEKIALLDEFASNLSIQIKNSAVLVALKKSLVNIKNKKLIIRVYGYASSTGSSKYNMKLSERRAKEVAKKIQEKLNIAIGDLQKSIRDRLIKIEVRYFGETKIKCKDGSKPMEINNEFYCPGGLSNEARDYNRRVDVVLSVE